MKPSAYAECEHELNEIKTHQQTFVPGSFLE